MNSFLGVWIRCAENVVRKFVNDRPQLLGYRLFHGGLEFVANASFFSAVVDISTRILKNVLILRLGLGSRP